MFKLLIDGVPVDSQDGKVEEIRNPARHSESVGEISYGGVEDAKRAVDAAYSALPKWSETPPRLRAGVLLKAADLVESSENLISETLTREQGKPLPESLGETRLSVSVLRYYAGLAPAISGRKVELTDPGEFGIVLKQPVGVAVAITPWNSPVILMAVKIAPALAAGNSVVVKPASSTPLADLLVCELISKAGLPAGTLNVVTGSGSVVGEELISNKKVSKVAFTGETETGKRVMSIASRGLKRLNLELGGSDPMIICNDADFGLAVEAALISRFRNCGQVCMSVKRLYVQEEVYDAFVERIVMRSSKITVGDGLAIGTKMGPLHSESQRDKIIDQVSDAQEKGARIAFGGKKPAQGSLSDGYFFMPTIATDVDPESKLLKEEVFGPVLPIFKFRSVSEAIELANDTQFGLGSSIWTKDLDKAMMAANKLASGTTWINSFHEPQIDLPFGGLKESGLGKEMSIEGLESFLETKSVVVNSRGKKRAWLDL